MQPHHHCNRQGTLSVVGIGPGNPEDRTFRADAVIRKCEVIVGYEGYLRKISDLLAGKEVISSGMRKEQERAVSAVERALAGRSVAVISSGDAGIYGMAGLVLEIVQQRGLAIDVEIVPGVTAASAAAAHLGAPLMLDFAAISLSDLLVPWADIEARVRAVAPLDMAVCLYNPKSRTRTRQLEAACDILKEHRSSDTPVGVCTSMGAADERIVLTDLRRILNEDIGMSSIVIVGSARTKVLGPYMVTLRGYSL